MPPAATVDENRSNHGWVNLLIESVNVPLDADESLLFSTVQSLIPGAHGLYFRDNGQRKALSLDASSGKVLSPFGGWTAQDIYVHLAHGHRHGANCGYTGEYTKASEIFERNLTAVQKLISQAGLGMGGMKRSGDAKASPKRSHKPKSGFEAQPEDVHVSDESESYLQQQLDAKKKELEQVATEKAELELRLKDTENLLETEKRENEELRKNLNESLAQSAPEIRIGSPESVSTSSEKKKKSKKGKGSEDPRDLTITQLQQELEFERQKCNELSSQLAASSSAEAASEAERNDTQMRIIRIQTELDAAHQKIQELIEKEEEMKVAVLEQRGPRADELEKMGIVNERNVYLEQTINALQNQLGEACEKLSQQTAAKDDLIGRMGDERNKLQWTIGELTQWWNDAKWKIGELEAANKKMLDDLALARDELKKLVEDTRNVTPSGINEAIAGPASRATFSVNRQPHSDRWQLQSYINTEPIHSPSMPAYPLPMPIPYFYPPYGFPVYPPPTQNETKKVLFEIEAPDAKTIFLAGSFLNWEVALLCRPLGNGKHGVWVDVPRGQYDFKFLVDGEWKASQSYHISNNEFGSLNNSRSVE